MQVRLRTVPGKTVAVASLVLAFVFIAGTAFAALTFNSTAITSDGALTLNPTGQPVTVNGNLTVTGSCTGCGGTPGGSNTQIQFNNSGAFAGSPNLTWDGSEFSTGIKGDNAAFDSTIRGWFHTNGLINGGAVVTDNTPGLSVVMQSSGGGSGMNILVLNTDPNADSDTSPFAINLDAVSKRAVDDPFSQVFGIDASTSNFGTGLVGETSEFVAGGSSSGNGHPVTNSSGLHSQGHGYIGTVNAMGVWIDDQNGSNQVSGTAYGLKIEDQTHGYSIYTGAGAVHFGDNVATTGSVTTPDVVTTPVTVSALPTCNSGRQGAHAFVTDANATTFNTSVAGGGSNKLPVFCDGTNWKIGG